jgi:hypothetical protein
MTEAVFWTAIPLACIQKAIGSNLDSNSLYPDGSFSSFYKCRTILSFRPSQFLGRGKKGGHEVA